MNTLKQLSTLALASLFIFSCSSDDDSIPEIVNEEELITTTEKEYEKLMIPVQ